jgi:DNA-binding response OmpR family regulator
MSHVPTEGHAPGGGRRVLLVEDNEAAARGLARLLASQGFDVTLARDGASAMDSLNAGAPPDILLTDMQLPDLDGRELARYCSKLDPRPRVVLITGWDLESTQTAAASWGVEHVMTKPLEIQELLRWLDPGV